MEKGYGRGEVWASSFSLLHAAVKLILVGKCPEICLSQKIVYRRVQSECMNMCS